MSRTRNTSHGEQTRPPQAGESPELDLAGAARSEGLPEDDEPSRLAVAYQAGDRTVLGALHRMLWPLMAPTFARYPARPGALPLHLEPSDLRQESWLILADLIEHWDAAGGSFRAYFRVSFPWAVARYVRDHSPRRRSKMVLVLRSVLPDVQRELDKRTGADGRAWDGDLAWSELLENLSDDERMVLLLHLGEQQTFTDLARAMQITRPAAFRLYQRALKQVQASPVRVRGRTVVLGPDNLNLERKGGLVELVRALHRGAQKGRLLPGRVWLVDETGFSEHRITRMLNLLVEAGCIRGRRRRHPGRLVHTTPEKTLAALGVRAERRIKR
jgi:RNA polymerase sigma factor (sigma-70 family)